MHAHRRYSQRFSSVKGVRENSVQGDSAIARRRCSRLSERRSLFASDRKKQQSLMFRFHHLGRNESYRVIRIYVNHELCRFDDNLVAVVRGDLVFDNHESAGNSFFLRSTG